MNDRLINNAGTKTQKKELNRFKKTVDFLNEQTESERMSDSIKKVNEVSMLETAFQSFAEKNKKENRLVLAEKAKIEKENTFNIFKETFANIVLESLPIDKQNVDNNREEIKEKVFGFVEDMREELVMNGILVEEVTNIAREGVMLVEQTKLSEGEVLTEGTKLEEDTISSNIEKVLFNNEAILETTGTISGLVEIIKEKVNKVLDNEKIFSEALLIKEEGKLNVEMYDTLFRKIQIENVKLALKECEEGTSNEDIMQIALYETIVDYAILEAANTMNMLNVNKEAWKQTKRVQRKIKPLFQEDIF